MEIAIQVVTLKASSLKHATMVEKLVTRSLIFGSWTKIRTSARRTSAEEKLSTMISGDRGEDKYGPDFLMRALCYYEEEGSTADMDYTIRAIKDIEEEMFDFVNEEDTFDFVNENEEEDSKGNVKSIDDFDYPLADEPMTETDLCAMRFPSS
jgi:hypothetical protein